MTIYNGVVTSVDETKNALHFFYYVKKGPGLIGAFGAAAHIYKSDVTEFESIKNSVGQNIIVDRSDVEPITTRVVKLGERTFD